MNNKESPAQCLLRIARVLVLFVSKFFPLISGWKESLLDLVDCVIVFDFEVSFCNFVFFGFGCV